MKHYRTQGRPFMPHSIEYHPQKKIYHPSFVVATLLALLMFVISASVYKPAIAQSPVLGEALQQPEKIIAESKAIQSASLQEASAVLAVDLSTRQEALDFYNENYADRGNTAMGWTGSQSSCNAGNVSGNFQNQYLHRINYFRAMAGVPGGVTLAPDYNQQAQQAALMMSVNDQLSHSPSSNWTCYTEAGKVAAGSSNLFLGMASVGSVDGYIMDPGGSNGHVGHRRWLLHPATRQMGIGSVAKQGDYREANAIWVFDSSIWDPRPATRDDFVAWPPPGFVPYQVTFARWSFAYPDADFSGASIDMVSNGQTVSVVKEATVDGFGENTLVWKAMGLADNEQWPQPAEDTPYTVTIRNVRIGGQARDFTYTVTVFDPAVEVAVPTIDVNFNAAAPGSFLTVRGDGFRSNQNVPIELNGTQVKNVQANANGELAVILNTRGASEGAYLISAPVPGSTPDTASGYSLDDAQPVRSKEDVPGAQTAAVRNVAPLKQLFVPLVSQ